MTDGELSTLIDDDYAETVVDSEWELMQDDGNVDVYSYIEKRNGYSYEY